MKRIKQWILHPKATFYTCLFFSGLNFATAIWLWEPYTLDAAIVWMLAAWFALRLSWADQDIRSLIDVVEIQTAIVKALTRGRYTEGESGDVDLGQGSGPPGSVPSP